MTAFIAYRPCGQGQYPRRFPTLWAGLQQTLLAGLVPTLRTGFQALFSAPVGRVPLKDLPRGTLTHLSEVFFRCCWPLPHHHSTRSSQLEKP